ncbi:MAG: hypothetical protein HGA49_09970 [Eubacteriaceae bacterium]|nr:hypothetical protein [Eubacteriaceae bacterium]
MIDRAYGCLLGAAIGDAMGMPASFMTPGQIQRVYGKIEGFLEPSKEEQLHHGHLASGAITDDTEESLIIAKVLLESGHFDEELFVKKMKHWAISTDILNSTIIGPSTRRFLEAVIGGKDYHEAGKTGDTNGGAMRVAPIGIFNHGNVEAAIKDAISATQLSHGSKPGLAAACAIVAAVALAIEGNYYPQQIIDAAMKGAKAGEKLGFDIPSPSVYRRIKLAKMVVEANQDRTAEEICHLLYEYIGAGMKSYESIPLCLGIFYAVEGDVKKGIIEAINIGDDADTNGSIVGALCGAYSGAKKIPKGWIKKIAENNIDFKEIAEKLVK